MSRAFEIKREIDLPATPDDVWVAITSDTAAWQFPTGMEIPAGDAPPEGSPVTTWNPPHRLVVRMQAPDGTFNALDYTIEARKGGTAHLRYVHSGILADEWEDQYDAIDGHTDFYLHTLGQYLEHFKGRRVSYVGQPSSGIDGPEAAGEPDAMERLRAALGVSRDAGVGDEVRASLGAAGALDGVIDYSTPEFLGIRTADGLYRFFGRNAFGGVVGMSAHLFVGGLDTAAREAALKAWLDSVYVERPSSDTPQSPPGSSYDRAMATLTVYEKPTCTTCRKLRALLAERGVEYESIDYHATGIREDELRRLLGRLGCGPRAVLRTRELPLENLGVDGAAASDDQLIALMAANPALLQRPIVVRGERAILARPIERVLELL